MNRSVNRTVNHSANRTVHRSKNQTVNITTTITTKEDCPEREEDKTVGLYQVETLLGESDLRRSVSTWAEAKIAGAKTYFTGEACRNGHLALRATSDGGCTICSREKGERWRAANPEKLKASQRAYQEANRAEMRIRSNAWKARNRDKCHADNAAWYAAHPERNRANVATQRARRRKAEGKYTGNEIKELAKKQKHRCAICHSVIGKNKFHADHIVPLARGGSNWISNIQLLCPQCNLRKGAKDPIEWAQKQGRLL